MEKLNIILALHSHKCGGAEKHALYLMESLIQSGHSAAYAGPRDSWLWEESKRAGIQSLSLPMHGTYDFYSVLKLAHFAKKIKAGLVHAHLTRGAFYGGLASKLSGVPCVATAHATHTHKHFQMSERLIAVSQAVKDNLVKKGLKPEKISVIHNSVPEVGPASPEEKAEKRTALGIKGSDIALFMAARFIEDKGHDLAIEALRTINNPRLHLFLAGKEEGEFHKKIEKTVMDYGLHDRVIFLDHREDVPALLGAMDIYLAPSRREAMPLSILEALSAGLSVIASDTGGIPEAITNGENGFLFRNGSWQELAGLIKRLADDKPLQKRLGENAYTSFKEKFTLRAMAEKTMDVYRLALWKAQR